MSTAGYLMVWVAAGTGPLAAVLVGGGIAVAIAGSLWSLAVKRQPLQELVKFSVFGNQPGRDIGAPPWALCPRGTFADWDPNTLEGLERQHDAALQLLFGFRVQHTEPFKAPGLASSVGVRLTPASIRGGSVFHLAIDAKYVGFRAGEVLEFEARCAVILPSAEGAGIRFSDPSSRFSEVGVTRRVAVLDPEVSSQAQPAIEVEFRLVVAERGEGWRPARFVCNVLLDVYGDGDVGGFAADASLLVPSRLGGGLRVVEATLITNESRAPELDTFSSDDVQ
jgi:hypothetical protein